MATKNARKSVKSAPASKKAVKSAPKKLDKKVVGTSAQGFGTAQEQNRAYAKLAKKYTLNSEVVELNGHKRKGYVAGAAAEGSGYVEVRFEDSTEVMSKHVADLKLIKQAKPVKLKFKTGDTVVNKANPGGMTATVKVVHANGKSMSVEYYDGTLDNMVDVSKMQLAKVKKVKPKFNKGDVVTHPAHGQGEVILASVKSAKTDEVVPGVLEVAFDKDAVDGECDCTEVHQDELIFVKSAKEAAKDKKASEKAARPPRIKFEQITLFGAFSAKDRTFVKVSKSNAIPAQVNGSTNEPFAMLATPEHKMADSAIQRFKKSDKVTPYQGGVVPAVAGQ